MSEKHAVVKPLIPFDEYYTVLKACVEDPGVIEAIEDWKKKDQKFYRETGDLLADSREESTECYDAYNAIGFAVSDVAVRFGLSGRLTIAAGNLLVGIVVQLIMKDWPKILPEDIGIDDKSKIKESLRKMPKVQIDFGDDA